MKGVLATGIPKQEGRVVTDDNVIEVDFNKSLDGYDDFDEIFNLTTEEYLILEEDMLVLDALSDDKMRKEILDLLERLNYTGI